MTRFMFRPWTAERTRLLRASAAHRKQHDDNDQLAVQVRDLDDPPHRLIVNDDHGWLPHHDPAETAAALAKDAHLLFPRRRITADELRALVRKGLRP